MNQKDSEKDETPKLSVNLRLKLTDKANAKVVRNMERFKEKTGGKITKDAMAVKMLESAPLLKSLK